MQLARTVDGGPVLFETKVELLATPASYPERTRSVEMVETHMSCVFLTDRHAYKLKKPVRLPYLDYTTLEARKRFCGEEVRINRSLAPGVYLRAVPLVLTDSGLLRIGGRGQVVDWLVKMRRLPHDVRLDLLIDRDAVDRDRLRDALSRLTAFYAKSEPVGLTASAYRARLRRAIDRNREALLFSGSHLSARMRDRVLQRQVEFVSRKDSPLVSRAGHVIEAHGDLRPEHVYLLDPAVIVDRLEFARDLRLLDPADELAFLALECHRLGAPWVEAVALEVYRQVTDDHPQPTVVAFYRSLRACMRARLAIGHLEQPDGPEVSRWHALAASYLETADTASRELGTS